MITISYWYIAQAHNYSFIEYYQDESRGAAVAQLVECAQHVLKVQSFTSIKLENSREDKVL